MPNSGSHRFHRRSACFALASALLAACGQAALSDGATGGGQGGSHGADPIAVTISPGAASVRAGGTSPFTCTVTGPPDRACTWAVLEGSGGSISAVGLYTAPATAGTYHVVAAARADASRTAVATVTVTAAQPGVDVVIEPTSRSLSTGGTWTFTCTVTGASDPACTWSVLEGATGGSVTGAGVYTAPATAGTYHVVAASRADASRSARATVTVTGQAPAVTVVVSPRARSLGLGAPLQLSASVTGSSDTAVSWAVQEGAAGGAVTTGGLYTAPQAAGVYHVVATSHADAGAKDTATLTVTSGTCSDACPAPKGGVTWQCEKRFMYGINWAWGEFGADFGGIARWNKGGVKARSASFDADMKRMKAAGVNVIRWWMFPRFLTEAIEWGADGAPSGIGGTMLADLEEALRLADANDLYVMLTPFSFDNFGPTVTESGGLVSRSIRPIVLDAALRRKLLDNLVKPVARAVEASPYRRRVVAWDLINEPEWALTGSDAYGDPAFEPSSKLEPVTHAQLEVFLQELAAVLRASSSALLSVGGAAIKWPRAWSKVDQDFYQFHYYDWVYEWFPYTTVTPASVGMNDKPVVVGEFPAAGLSAISSRSLPARTATELSADLWSLGWAGAMAWAFNDPGFPWRPETIQAFHDQHACETAY